MCVRQGGSGSASMRGRIFPQAANMFSPLCCSNPRFHRGTSLCLAALSSPSSQQPTLAPPICPHHPLFLLLLSLVDSFVLFLHRCVYLWWMDGWVGTCVCVSGGGGNRVFSRRRYRSSWITGPFLLGLRKTCLRRSSRAGGRFSTLPSAGGHRAPLKVGLG